MGKLIKIAYLSVKNIVFSKKFLLGIMGAFAYSMLWILIVHPPRYGLDGYVFEIGRFLYVILLYAATSLLRNDIRFNTTKTIFTGMYSRTQIMFSKGIALIILGVVFYLIIEVNNVLASLLLYRQIGIAGFLEYNHLQLFVTYMVITLTMGSLMLFIISILFHEKKSILFYIVFFSMINFYTAAITMLITRQPQLEEKFSAFMKTPFYNVVDLTQGNFNMEAVGINLVWAVIFLVASTVIMNRREIK